MCKDRPYAETDRATQPDPNNRRNQVISSASHEGIGWAIKQMWNGQAVRRRGWNGRNMWVRLQVPDPNSKMTLPYIFMRTVTGDMIPWLASQTDLLAMDWEFAEE